MPEEPSPTRPRDADVPEDAPISGSLGEGARLLANEARDRLRADGFDDAEIDAWADAFLTDIGGGSAEDLVSWIRNREAHANPERDQSG